MVSRPVVLVAVDHATDIERVMEFALSTATARGADVHVIHVVPHRAALVHERTGHWRLERHNDRGVASGAPPASIPGSADHRDVHVRRVTLRGEPEHVIPAYARLYEASVLLVERHYGSSRFWRNGRVVGELARRSPMPLLVLPRRRLTEPPRRILAPFDFSVASAVALRTAVRLARREGARVTLLHTLNDVSPHMVFGGREAWEAVRRLPALKDVVAERLRRKAAFFGARDVDTEVTTGAAADAILELDRRGDTDLIVMGVADRSWLERLLVGSTLGRVLLRANAPVLVVPVVAGAHPWPIEHLAGPPDSALFADPVVERAAA